MSFRLLENTAWLIRPLVVIAVAMALALAMVGCRPSARRPATLVGPDELSSRRPLTSGAPSERPYGEEDRAGSLYRAAAINGEVQQNRAAQEDAGEEVAPSVRQTVESDYARRLPGTAPATQPSARPATGVSTGTYVTVGAVVVNVGGTPIYSGQVIEQLEPLLAAEARQRDPESFRSFARKEIERQVSTMIQNELVLEQARQKLTPQQQKQAEQLTVLWRDRQIREAGGSIEQARAKFAAEGLDFDTQLEFEYRKLMAELYLFRVVFPRVQVTAEDLRQYYSRHLATEFATPAQVQFRLIKIDPKRVGTREQALEKAQDIRQRASRGDDFATLAREFNHDARLARADGLEQTIAQGSYANQAVEDAVFKLQPGEVTPVIETPDALYVAKVESRKLAVVRPFEDPAVQDQIRETLRKRQIDPMWEKEKQKLVRSAVITPNPPLVEPVVELAMQMYPKWTSQ